jgi:cyclophilin family peptidyl-prolyl cis-trans isomerase/HEAT repeat protein
MKNVLSVLAFLCLCALQAFAQIPINTSIQILKAEDARRYDSVLENILKSSSPDIRTRAALAAGRIGDEKAVPALAVLLGLDQPDQVQEMAAFALGEIESIKGAEPILKRWNTDEREKPSMGGTPILIRPRLTEAAGKIAAANADDPRSKDLSNTILRQLWELEKAPENREWILLCLTAVLRTKPEGADGVVAKFLTHTDPRIRADAANTLTRLKAKNANETLRKMLATDTDPIARANAARALGAAEDKDALEPLKNAATKDQDLRVRVSAIRAVGSLKDTKAAVPLMERGEILLAQSKKELSAYPPQKNELIEIAVVLGRLLADSGNDRAVKFLGDPAMLDNGVDPQTSVARFRVKPGDFEIGHSRWMGWQQFATNAQILTELATVEPKTDEVRNMKAKAPALIKSVLAFYSEPGSGDDKMSVYAMPDYLRAYAAFKPADLDQVLRANLDEKDVFLRAAAAELIADGPVSKQNTEALKKAFDRALVIDKVYDDAELGILDALYKLNKKEAVGTLLVALRSTDYLVRKKAFGMLSDKDLQKVEPGISGSLESARAKNRDQVLPYSPEFGTKLGQLLNTDADYRRALMRKNGNVKAVVATEKGTFTIELFPEDAPLTVDNFIKLAQAKYFDGVLVHRVVPNFVMQDGDPRGDGNGGPGWSIRCEINMRPYDRGAVGMALSGKDTGGSQWFVTHSPQPHLDGGYTVFGHVNEADMKVVDNIVRGDRISSVKIMEGKVPQGTQRTQRKTRKR